MIDDLHDKLWRAMQAHGVGWIDNGTPDAHCYCGHRPARLGASWHVHVADSVVTEIGLREEKAIRNVALTPPIVNTYRTPEAAVKDYVGAPPYVRQDLQLVRRYVTEWTRATAE